MYTIHMLVPRNNTWQSLAHLLEGLPGFDVITSELAPTMELWAEDRDCDVRLVCLPDNPEKVCLSPEKPDGLISQAKSLFITNNSDSRTRYWAFRHGADDVMIYPVQLAQIHLRLQNLALANRKRLLHQVPAAEIKEFIKALINRQVETLKPALDPYSAIGHYYPDVMEFFCHAVGDQELLERLTEESYLERRIVNRIRLCPVCDDNHLNFRETCPSCKSLNFKQEEMLHHFPCGYVNSASAFKTDMADLSCPKCNQVLRHIGMDYERISENFLCQDCMNVFASPRVEAQCIYCGFVCDPTDTYEKVIWEYTVTKEAHHAVSDDRTLANSLAGILHNRYPGLYSRQYFEFELQREMRRAQRKSYSFCLMMVRIEDFHHLQNEHQTDMEELLTDVYKSIENPMSDLDVACLATVDTVGILLPGASLESVQPIAKAMHDNINKLTHLTRIHSPEISISIIQSGPEYTSPEDMMQAAITDVKELEPNLHSWD